MSYEVNTGTNYDSGPQPGAAYIPPGDVEWDKPKRARRWPWILGIVAALVIGAAIGASGQSNDTKTVTKTVTVTSVVDNTVTQTPQSCKDALAAADEAFGQVSVFAGHVAEAMGASSDAFTALGNGDIAGVTAAASKMSEVTPKLTADEAAVEGPVGRYRTARDACNAS